jgi:hypothetical protein
MNVNFDSVPSFVTAKECKLVVEQICNQFCAAGMQTVRTFDLKTTLPSGKRCDCNMVVLLVYGKQGPPFSLSIYGESHNTTVMLQDCRFDIELVTTLLAGVLNGNV